MYIWLYGRGDGIYVFISSVRSKDDVYPFL